MNSKRNMSDENEADSITSKEIFCMAKKFLFFPHAAVSQFSSGYSVGIYTFFLLVMVCTGKSRGKEKEAKRRGETLNRHHTSHVITVTSCCSFCSCKRQNFEYTHNQLTCPWTSCWSFSLERWRRQKYGPGTHSTASLPTAHHQRESSQQEERDRLMTAKKSPGGESRRQ